MVTMIRRLTFSAAHADWLASLSPAENAARFGPRARPEPHGHDFVLDVVVRGEIDPKTGIIVNIKEIDQIVRRHIVQLFDQRFINHEVKAFCDRPATAENLCAFIAAELTPRLPASVTLSAVRLEETPLNWAEWSAEENRDAPGERGMMQVTRVYEFAASHRLHSPFLSDAENQELFGKCNYAHGHGHNYVLEITVAGPTDPRTGRVLDPAELDAVVHREVVDRYDHRHFNYDIPEFEGLIPSTEVIVKMIWQRLRDHIPAPARLTNVLLRETARNFFAYQGEDAETV